MTTQNFQAGIILVVFGVIGGLFRYLYEVSVIQSKEKRFNDILSSLSTVFGQFLQVVHESGATESAKDKTLH
jgi:hypothetical protein